MPKYANVTDLEDDGSSITKSDSRRTSKSPSIDEMPSESSPLLRSPRVSRGEYFDLPKTARSKRSPQVIMAITMVVLLLITCGDQLMDSPQTRIIESVICYEYWEKVDPSKLEIGREGVGPGAVGGVAEIWCKTDAVQSQLALLRGWQTFLDGFPSLVLAIPFGWAADRFGRKPVLLMGVISFPLRAGWIQFVCWFWQAFDIRMTWLSSLHGLLGGSSPVVVALLFVLLSDITPEADRASVFLRVGASTLISALICPPISAALMKISPWIPSLAGTLLEILAVPLFLLVPETLDYRHPFSPSHSHPPSPTGESAPAPATPDLATGAGPVPPTHWYSVLKSAMSFIFNDWRVPVLVLPFFLHNLVASIGQLLLQYISKRYTLTFSEATLLLTIRAAVNAVTLFFILPWLSTYVMRYFHLCGQRKDLYLARISALIVGIGWCLVSISPDVVTVIISLIVTTLGIGWPLLLRSFITSLVPAHHVARLFTLISIIDTVGLMIGAPFLALLFKKGMSLGGGWIGLPFALTGFMFFVLTGILCIVKVRNSDTASAPEEGDGDIQI